MTSTNSDSKILAIILSGGAGHRFGGADKGLQIYKGRTLIEHTITAIKPQVNELVLCINRNEDDYIKLGHPLVFDESTADYQGPLAGIAAAYKWLRSDSQNYDYVLISSCDSPKLPCNYVSKLRTALEQSDAVSAVVHDGERKQNLHCLIHSNALPSLVTFFNKGGRAMHRWHQQKGLTEVDFSDQADCFSNFNYAEQLTDK